jgi:hypothetical protein
VYDTVRVVGFDVRKDLAIIQVAGFDLPVVDFANSNQVSPGEPVLLLGSPRGLAGTVTMGVVSAIRSLPIGVQVIQTDAAANPGSSGGPLLNSQGQVIGVLSSKVADAENMSFAVPANYLRGLLGLSEDLTLEQLRSRLEQSTDVFASEEAKSEVRRWKSLLTGTSREVRFEENFVYVEVILPPERKQPGDFTLCELRKSGEIYKGQCRARFTCQYRDLWTGRPISNQCPVESEIEVSSVAPGRIEGRSQGPSKDTKLDCKKCKFSKGWIWQEFVWIPE